MPPIASIWPRKAFLPALLRCLALMGVLALAGCISDSDVELHSASRSQLATTLAETASTPTPVPSTTPEAIAQPSTVATPSPPMTLTMSITPIADAQHSTADTIASVNKPDRDLVQLAIRYGLADRSPPRTVTRVPAKVGDEESFWISNTTNDTYFQASARLVIQTERASFWTVGGSTNQDERLKRAAVEFENRIFDTLAERFGFAGHPAIEDFHVNILHGNVPGVAGYYSSSDEYPNWVNRHSNQRKMIYINTAVMRPGTENYYAVVAHELMHALQWIFDSSEATWVSEGTAELAADAVYGPLNWSALSYLERPSTQLNAWIDPREEAVLAHYGGGYLFFRYLVGVLGDFKSVGDILLQMSDGIAGVESYFREAAISKRFEDLFADWAVANYLRDTSISDGQYGYEFALAKPAVTPIARIGSLVESEISPFSVHYLELTPANTGFKIEFAGDPEVQVVPVDPELEEGQWWSNRGDSINTRLTRTVDLTNVSSATLTYRIWHDIEKDFDYGYLSASTDKGRRWQTIQTPLTTQSNPNGQNYGDAYNGENTAQQARWIDEAVDLTQFAGQKIQLRFEYVTDDAYVREGFGIEGIEIEALGWKDRPEDAGWQSDGFVRLTDNRLTASYRIALIRLGDPPQIEWIPLDDRQRGTLSLKPEESAVLVLINTTRFTNQPAGYRLSISPAN